MTRDAVLEILRAHETALRRQGVKRAALFGSTARGEATGASDVDILVEMDPGFRTDLYQYVGLTQYIAALFSTRVEVSDHAMLVDPVKQSAERDAVYAF